MYPANFFGLFPAFPRENTVFVAMSFDPIFDNRWKTVICPAIQSISIKGIQLRPVRVDERLVGDSILTEILSGISSSLVMFADISSNGRLDNRPIRNGNVMYEVGLAHAVRLPEEVILFRSDQEHLLFDTANVRINTYSPDAQPDQARQQIIDAINSAIEEINLRRHLAVKKAADSLDFASVNVLIDCQHKAVVHPLIRTMRDALSSISITSAIQRLLEMGLLKVDYISPQTKEQLEAPFISAMPYRRTALGDAVFHEISARLTAKNVNGQTHSSVQ